MRALLNYTRGGHKIHPELKHPHNRDIAVLVIKYVQ
jgi:hypothetical protein